MWGKNAANARHAETTMHCHECNGRLDVERTCHTVYMHCTECKKDFPVQEYIKEMDDALEEFMEGVYCNRI